MCFFAWLMAQGKHLPEDRIEDTHTHSPHTHTHTLKSSVRTVCISVEIWIRIFLKQSSRLSQWTGTDRTGPDRTVTSGRSEWCAVTSCPSQVRRLYNTNCNGSFLQGLFVSRFGTSCTHSCVSCAACAAACFMSTTAILIYTKPKRWVQITRKFVADI